MTLDQLTNLVTIVEVGSFKAASEALHKTQPTLSASIKNLEEELGIKIFSREKYRPELTNAGIALYEKAKKVIFEAKSFMDLGDTLSKGSEALIRVGIDIVSPRSSSLTLLEEFFSEHQSTKLQLNLGVLTSIADDVKMGKLDIGICPLFKPDSEIEAVPFLEKLHMVPVFSKKLFSKNKLSVSDLKKKPQIILQTPNGTRGNISAGVLEGGTHWHTYHSEVKMDLIRAGLCWGSLPEYQIKDELNSGKLIPIENSQIKKSKYRIYLIKKQGREFGPVSLKLWRQLMSLRDAG